MAVMKYPIKTLGATDVLSTYRLIHAAGWTSYPGQVELLQTIGAWRGHWDHLTKRLISCAGFFPFGTTYASLGIVIVDPEYQHQGLGRDLLQQLLAEENQLYLPVVLVATAAGEPLYRTLGFETVRMVHRLQLDTSQRRKIQHDFPIPSRFRISPMTLDDIQDAIRLDEATVGADRTALYQALLPVASETILVRHTCGELLGCAVATQRGNQRYLGPVVAKSDSVGRVLVDKLLARYSGLVRLDLLGQQPSFRHILEDFGFQETMTSPFMCLGQAPPPLQDGSVYTLADPALG